MTHIGRGMALLKIYINAVLVLLFMLDTVHSQDWHFEGVNIAKGKSTTQAPGARRWNGQRLTSPKAVDGNTRRSAGSCSSTTGAYNAKAFWSVDLGELHFIKGIRLYNFDGYKYRLQNVRFFGSPTRTLLFNTSNPAIYLLNIINVPVNPPKQFSNITVEVPPHTGYPDGGRSFVNLCELQVFAVSYRCPVNNFNSDLRWVISKETGYLNDNLSLVSTGTVLEFTCIQNFTLIGSTRIECLSSGQYNESVPTCEPYVCPTPTFDVNLDWTIRQGTGHINNDELISSGAFMDFGCEHNYNLVGFVSVQCLSNGTYTASVPWCNETRCTRPSNVLHGKYNQELDDSYSVGAVLNWSCSYRYKSDFSKSRQCTNTSMWSGDDPECVLITCSYPNDLSNVILNFDNGTTYSSGEVTSGIFVLVQCEQGLKTNITEIQCLQEEWNALPTCVLITCEELGDFHGGQYIYNKTGSTADQNSTLQYPYGTEATPECNTSFTLTRGRPRRCGESGNWTSEVIICDPLCVVPLLDHGVYIDQLHDTLSENETAPHATPRCDAGYTIELPEKVASATLTCLENHTWNGGHAQCIPVCVVQILQNGYFKDRKNNTLSENDTASLVTPTCDDGHTREPTEEMVNTTLTCLANHTWDGEPANCIPVDRQRDTSAQQSSVVGAAAGGGVAAAVVVLAVVGVVGYFLIRRRNQRKDHPESAVAYNNPVRQSNIDPVSEDHMYAVCPKENVIEEIRDTYYSFGDNPKQPERAINVSDLAIVVFNPDSISRFSEEFATFPEGMTQPHQQAIKNRHLNRYKKLYAYDESRVILDIWNENTDTDYINACYIHGFRKPKAYIASQGPTVDNVNDFWRMIWQTNSDKIVMLTNLFEGDKMKCIRYWPEETHMYGEIEVKLDSIETFTNFVIRTLLMTKTCEPQRRVHQFHFTTWPDKDVPYFSSSLVHFRNKVKAVDSVCGGPVVVHCSAGVGRTGTFIAIDLLTDQANALGYVDVAGCVDELRRQRVDMVQKEKQYVFVHQALVEILILETSVVQTSSFEKSYQNLQEPVQGRRKLDAEFELLWKFSPKASSHGADNQDENVYANVQAANAYMPSLSKAGRKLRGEYIDATFLPMYREDNALSITVTPLDESIEDFWKLVYHQNVHTIVMMDDVTDQNMYWPDVNTSATYEGFTITNDGADKKGPHKVVQITICHDGKEERAIQLLQFGRWASDNLLPDNPRDIITAIDLVETHKRNFGNCPVVVHCSDGRERSGLYCVIAATLDRTKIEQDVAISQVIQEMRHRRGNVIPNVEQFQCCHEVIQQFLQQFETYSNFAFNE